MSYFKTSFPPGNFNGTHKTCKLGLCSSISNKNNNLYFFQNSQLWFPTLWCSVAFVAFAGRVTVTVTLINVSVGVTTTEAAASQGWFQGFVLCQIMGAMLGVGDIKVLESSQYSRKQLTKYKLQTIIQITRAKEMGETISVTRN